MDTKMRVKANLGIQKIIESIKPEIIAEACGIPYKTFMAKAKGQVVNGSPLFFFGKDLDKINLSLPLIAKKLQKIEIPYISPKCEDRINKSKTLQPLKENFQLKYFYGKLGKDTKWFSKRMLEYSSEKKNYYFTESEILTINLAVKESVSMLSSIELI